MHLPRPRCRLDLAGGVQEIDRQYGRAYRAGERPGCGPCNTDSRGRGAGCEPCNMAQAVTARLASGLARSGVILANQEHCYDPVTDAPLDAFQLVGELEWRVVEPSKPELLEVVDEIRGDVDVT